MAKNNTSPQDCGYPQCPIEFLTELLEKLVEAQLSQSEKMAKLANEAEQNSENIEWIKVQFTNGFRSEIKTHISKIVGAHDDESNTKLDELTKEVANLNDKVDTYRQPKFLAKVILATLVLVAGTIFFVTRAYNLIHDITSHVEKVEKTEEKKAGEEDGYEQLKLEYEALQRNHDLLKRSKGDKNGRDTDTRPWQ